MKTNIIDTQVRLKKMIADDNLKGVISDLLFFLENSDRYDELVLTSNNFKNLKNAFHNQTISNSQFTIKRNKIILNLIEIINSLDKTKSISSFDKELKDLSELLIDKESSIIKRKYTIILLIVLIGLFLLYLMSFVTIEVDGDGNTIINGNGNKIIKFYNRSNQSKTDEKLIGNWRTTESWSNIVTLDIEGNAKFEENNKFTNSVIFKIDQFKFAQLEYIGIWSLENSNLIMEDIQIINGGISNKFGESIMGVIMLAGTNAILKDYIKDFDEIKIEKIHINRQNLIKTTYNYKGYNIEKTYKRGKKTTANKN